MKPRLHQLLRELQTALGKVLGDSTEISQAVDRIREEGWSLYLVIDRESDEDGVREALELTTRGAGGSAEPVFRIDGRDLTFLRSVGIDPTRKLRRRR